MATKTASVDTRYRSLTASEVPAKLISGCLVLLLCNALHTSSAIGSGTKSLEHCLQQRHMGAMGSCLGQQALSYMQSFEDSQNVTLFDGSLKIELDQDLKPGAQSRSIVNFLDLNPSDFR